MQRHAPLAVAVCTRLRKLHAVAEALRVNLAPQRRGGAVRLFRVARARVGRQHERRVLRGGGVERQRELGHGNRQAPGAVHAPHARNARARTALYSYWRKRARASAPPGASLRPLPSSSRPIVVAQRRGSRAAAKRDAHSANAVVCRAVACFCQTRRHAAGGRRAARGEVGGLWAGDRHKLPSDGGPPSEGPGLLKTLKNGHNHAARATALAVLHAARARAVAAPAQLHERAQRGVGLGRGRRARCRVVLCAP